MPPNEQERLPDARAGTWRWEEAKGVPRTEHPARRRPLRSCPLTASHNEIFVAAGRRRPVCARRPWPSASSVSNGMASAPGHARRRTHVPNCFLAIFTPFLTSDRGPISGAPPLPDWETPPLTPTIRATQIRRCPLPTRWQLLPPSGTAHSSSRYLRAAVQCAHRGSPTHGAGHRRARRS